MSPGGLPALGVMIVSLESERTATAACYPPLVQPKPVLRWMAVLLAAAGWYLSFQSLRVSAGVEISDPVMRMVCGGPDDPGGCGSVLTSPQAYWGRETPVPIPVSTFGLGYFAFVGLWYVLIGPPTRDRRLWHVVLAVVVFLGVLQSLAYIRIMAFDLRQWCEVCLLTHGVNGALAILTVLAWPWRRRPTAWRPHPPARLVLATMLAGGLAFIGHVALVYVYAAGAILQRRTAAYAEVLEDPEFIRWHFERQPTVDIPLYEDEWFAGSPTAANTVVIFSDFQCTHCRGAEQMITEVLARYPDRLRVAHRYYPQDAECNPDPRYRTGGHAAACRAARAALAVRVVAGDAAYGQMRKLLYERQREFPDKPLAEQDAARWEPFQERAVELGVDAAAFAAAMDSPAVHARVQGDIALAEQLGVAAIPVVYLNGKRLLGWSQLDTWSALLQQDADALGSAGAPAAP